MLLAIWDDGVWQDAARLAIIGLVAYTLVLWVGALVWVYRDISSRTRDTFTQTIALVVVFIFNIPGLLLYLVLRPKDTLAEAYDRQLEAEALLHEIQDQPSCPSCRRRIEPDFMVCPYCRTTLRSPCAQCGKPLSSVWVLCPYCGVRPSAPVAASMKGAPGADQPAPAPFGPRPKRGSTATYTPPAAKSAAPSPNDAASDAGS